MMRNANGGSGFRCKRNHCRFVVVVVVVERFCLGWGCMIFFSGVFFCATLESRSPQITPAVPHIKAILNLLCIAAAMRLSGSRAAASCVPADIYRASGGVEPSSESLPPPSLCCFLHTRMLLF